MSSISSFYENLLSKRKIHSNFEENIHDLNSYAIISQKRNKSVVPGSQNIEILKNTLNKSHKLSRPATREGKAENKKSNYSSIQTLFRPLSSKPIPYIKYTNDQLNRLSNSDKNYLPIFAQKIDIKPLIQESKSKKYQTFFKSKEKSQTPFLAVSIKNAENNEKYTFCIKEGNNSNLIRKILSRRNCWKEVSDSACNFQWYPFSNTFRFEKLRVPYKGVQNQCINHFENHRELSLKSRLIYNISKFCSKRNLNAFDFCPISFYLDLDSEDVLENMKNFLSFFVTTGTEDKKNKILIQNEATSFYRKFVELYSLKQKDSVLFKKNKGVEDNTEKIVFKMKPVFSIPRTFLADKNIWLLKPIHLNRGRGIKIFNELKSLYTYLSESLFNDINEREVNYFKSGRIISSASDKSRKMNLNGLKNRITSKFILQKYIEKPLLINQRKFDIRVWVLITQDLNLYFFKEGYIRTSSEEFNLSQDKIENYFIHLTNNAVQKHSQNYGLYENGNQISFEIFQKYLNDAKLDLNFRKSMISKMKEYITLSVQSVAKKLNPRNLQFSFEIFGYDFMIDALFNLWLIEVNTNPCIEESSPLLEILLPRMINDAFKITLDVIFPPFHQHELGKEKESEEIVYKVPNYSDEENMWEYLGNFI